MQDPDGHLRAEPSGRRWNPAATRPTGDPAVPRRSRRRRSDASSQSGSRRVVGDERSTTRRSVCSLRTQVDVVLQSALGPSLRYSSCSGTIPGFASAGRGVPTADRRRQEDDQPRPCPSDRVARVAHVNERRSRRPREPSWPTTTAPLRARPRSSGCGTINQIRPAGPSASTTSLVGARQLKLRHT